MGQPPKCPEMARFRPPAGVSLSLFDTGVRGQGSAWQAQKRRPSCWIMLWSTMIHHREGPLMQQRLSKLEAAQRLGVSPSTLDRMIRRGELEIEREGRGDRAKVWVLAPGLSSDAPGGQPVDAGPSPEAELAALPGTAGGAQEESGDAGGADQGAAARRDGGVTPGTALVALRTGLDRFLSPPPPVGAETRYTTGPTSRRLLHPGPCGFGPAVPGGAGPRRRSAGAVVAPGPGPWTPSAASEALRSCHAPCRWSHGGSSAACAAAP